MGESDGRENTPSNTGGVASSRREGTVVGDIGFNQQHPELRTLLLPNLTNHLCSGTWAAVPISVMPYRSQSQLHQVEGPCPCTALRTVYQKCQDNNGFCKDVMKLYEKLQFRVHWDSLAFSYWRRCSFHCRFLLSFGGISNSGSERQTGQVSEQKVTAIWFLQELWTT